MTPGGEGTLAAGATGTGFGQRLAEVFASRGRLCVGIDPHSFLLEEWGLSDSAAGVREFGLRVVEATVRGGAGIVKPQVAFFERFGSAGYAALEEIIQTARAAGILVIADCKRGDVGTSVEAYGQSWMAEGSPLESDAMTISAFQGVGSIRKPMELARERGKGLFVLAATSNPEGRAIQRARVEESGRRVSRQIVDEIAAWNLAEPGPFGGVGLVVGATLNLADFDLSYDEAPEPALPILAPGFGAQGARLADTREIYGPLAPGVIVSASRSVLAAGPGNITGAIVSMTQEIAVEYDRA